MNKVILNGNLVRDMEIRTVSKSKTLVGEFTLAVNEGYGDNQKTTFVKCSLFGTRVESLQKLLLKGTKVLIDGRLEINNVEGKNGWQTYVNVVVDQLDILKFVEFDEEPKANKKYSKKVLTQKQAWEEIDDGYTPF